MNIQVTSRLAEQRMSYNLKKLEIFMTTPEIFEMKTSTQPATLEENLDNCAIKISKY